MRVSNPNPSPSPSPSPNPNPNPNAEPDPEPNKQVLPAGTAEAFVEAASWEARLTLDDLEPGAPPVPELHPEPLP